MSIMFWIHVFVIVVKIITMSNKDDVEIETGKNDRTV